MGNVDLGLRIADSDHKSTNQLFNYLTTNEKAKREDRQGD